MAPRLKTVLRWKTDTESPTDLRIVDGNCSLDSLWTIMIKKHVVTDDRTTPTIAAAIAALVDSREESLTISDFGDDHFEVNPNFDIKVSMTLLNLISLITSLPTYFVGHCVFYCFYL